MKKYYILLSLFVLTVFGGTAQNFLLQENFNTAAQIPAGWQGLLDNGVNQSAWQVGSNLSTATFIIPANDGNYAVSNDNQCQCNLNQDRLITPAINYTGITNPTLRFKSYLPSPFAPGDSKGFIYLVDALDNYTLVQEITPNASWTTYTISLGGLSGNIRVAFVHSDAAAALNFSGWAIDDVEIYAPYANDLTISSVNSPVSGCLADAETVQIKIKNIGLSTANSYTVSYTANGGTPVVAPVSAQILPGNEYTYTFTTPVNLTQGALNTLVATVNLSGDNDNSNDSKTVQISRNSAIQLGTTDAFTGNASYVWGLSSNAKASSTFSTDMIVLSGSGASGWVGTSSGTTAANAWTNNTDYHSSVELLCNGGNVPQVNKSLELSFDLRQETGLSSLYSWFGVFVNGNQIADVNGVLNFNPATPNSDQFTTRTFNLSSFKNTSFTIELRSSLNKLADKVYIDNVVLNERNEFDAGIVAILSPESNCGLSNVQNLQVKIKNYGLSQLVNVPVYYELDNGTAILAGVYPGPLATGATSTTISFNNLAMNALATSGNHTLRVFTQASGDNINTANDAMEVTIVNQPVVNVFPYTEDFEAVSNWAPSGTNNSWEVAVPAGIEITPTVAGSKAMITNADGNYNANEVSYITSPCFDFSALTNAKVEFSLYVHSDPEDDGAQLQYSINNGPWLLLGTVPSPPNPTNWYFDNVTSLANTGGWSAETNGWVTASYDLGSAPFVNASNVRFRFKFASDADNIGINGEVDYDGIAIDNFYIGEPQANLDLKLNSILTPGSGTNLTSSEVVSVQIANTGLSAVSSFSVTYQVDAGVPVTENFTQNIASGDVATVTFTTPVDFSAVGTYSITATVNLVNDGNITNDSKTAEVINLLLVNQYPYAQDFQGLNHQWTSGGVFSSWQLEIPAGTVITADQGPTDISWVTSLNAGDYYNSENSYVQSPEFDFTNLIEPAVRFRFALNSEPGTDGARLEVSTDGGTNFSAIGVLASPPNVENWYLDATAAFGGSGSWSGQSAWVEANQSLASLSGESSVIFRVVFKADATVVNEGFAFDDFTVFEAAPHDLAITSWTTQAVGCGLGSAEAITVVVENNGVFTENDFTLSYTIDLNGSIVTINEVVSNANLAPGGTLNYTFTALADFSALGTYVCSATATLASESNATDNTINKTITNFSLINTYPHLSTFETSDGGWFAGGVNSTFELGVPANVLINAAAGGQKAWVTNLDGSHAASENSYIESQCYNFTGLLKPAISFDYIIQTEVFNGSIAFDGARLEVSTNGGATWSVVGAVGDTTNWYNYTSVSTFGETHGWAGNSATWKSATYLLDNLLGETNVKFRFAFKADGFNNGSYEGFGVDNIKVFNDLPSDVGISAIASLNNCEFLQNVPVVVTIKNYSTDHTLLAGDMIPVSYTFGATTVNEVYTLTANLVPGATIDYTFSATIDLDVANTYSISATTDLDLDIENVNDGTNANFTVYPTPILSESVTEVSCFGGNTGAITLLNNPTNTYLWSANAGSVTTESVSGLIAGDYFVTITSADNCTYASAAITVTEPLILALSGVSTDPGCDAALDGSIAVTVTGGVSPYDYSWNAGTYTTEDLSGIGAGSYTLIVTDANLCSETISFTLTDAVVLPLVENFEGLVLPSGWVRSQNVNSVGWEFGTDINHPIFPFFSIPAHTGYAAANDNKNDDFSAALNIATEDLLITPRMDFSGYTHVNLQFDAFFEAFADIATVELTTNGGLNWTVLQTLTSASNWQEDLVINLDAYLNSCAVQIAFRYNDAGEWGNGFAIDNVSIVGTVQPAFDLAVQSIVAPGASSCAFTSAESVTVSLSNLGTAAANGAGLDLFLNGNLVATEILPVINAGATVNYTFNATIDLSVPANYQVEVAINWNDDSELLNNSAIATASSYPTINTFPFVENFDDSNFFGFALANGAQATAAYQAGTLVFGGGSPIIGWTGGLNATESNAWNDNTSHQASATSLCAIDATGMSSLELLIDLKQVYLSSPLNSWFRVLVNGVQVGSSYNPSALNEPFETLKVDLDAYLNAPFTLAFEASNNTTSNQVILDNLIIREKQNDLSITSISVNNAVCSYTNAESVVVNLQNNGGLPLSGFDIILSVNGIPVSTETYIGTLAVNGTGTFTFSGVDLSSYGDIELVATANVVGDVNNLDNFASSDLYNIPTYNTYPYVETPSNFQQYWLSTGVNSSWAYANGAWETGIGALTYNALESSAIVSPCFDFSTLVKPVISFDFSYATEANVDYVQFEYSINGGPWTVLTNAAGGTNWYTGVGSGNLTLRTVSCNTNLGGQSAVKFRIHLNSDDADQFSGVYFTNFQVFEMPDIAVTAVAPATACSDADFTISATLTNNGPVAIPAGTAVTLNYSVASLTDSEDFILTNGLAAGSSQVISFTNSVSVANVNPYTLTVTASTLNDYNAANNSFTSTLNIVPAPVVGAATNIGICEGNSVTLTATGGVTYVWSGGVFQGVPFFPSQTSTYTVTVTNAIGCQATSEVLVVVHPIPVADAGPDQFVCFGETATVTATGGATYQWINGGTNASFSYVVSSTNTFTVLVSDANGCSDYASVTVNKLDLPVASVSSDETICLGETITLSASGGSSYLWSNGGNTASINVTPNVSTSYTVTVYSADLCQDVETIDVTVINQPVITDVDVVNNNCFNGTSGSIDLTVSGSLPITYAWSGNIANGPSVSGLAAGIYSVTIQDSYGAQCQTVATYTITQPNGPVVATIVDVTNNTGYGISCNGANDGSLLALGTNGTAPYTYNWDNNANTAGISNLSAGTYAVTITDFYGCIANASYVVTEPTAISASLSNTAVSCNGSSDGNLLVTAQGGVLPYTYTWGPANVTTNNPTFSGIAGGLYTVTLTDANGCTWTESTTVYEPAPLAITLDAVSSYNGYGVSCAGGSNGSISIVASGGNGTYTYIWNNGMTSASVSGLSAGTFSVTVSDLNSCTAVQNYTLTSPNFMLTSTQSTQVSCNGGSNGAINLTVTFGGLPPFSYLWSNGQTTEDVTGLVAGTYVVTITDFNGCTTTKTTVINQPGLLVASTSVTSNWNGANVSCPGSTNGSAAVSVSGGTAPFSYLWSDDNNTVFSNVTGLAAGSYNVTVTDAKGCQAISQVVLVDPQPVSAVVSATSTYGPNGTNISCFGLNNGTAAVTAQGGTGAYSYSWSGSGLNAASVSNLSAGIQSVTVSDANGCTTEASVTLTQPTQLVADVQMVQSVSCTNDDDGILTVVVSGGVGNYTYNWSSGLGTGSTVNGLSAGTYFVTVADENSCTVVDSYTLINPAPVSADLFVTSNYNGYSVSCFGSADGSMQINAAGGSGVYTYHWNHDANNTSNIATSVSALAYIVTVTDSKGCTASDFVLLTQPAAIEAPAVYSNYNGYEISCNGENDGSLAVTAAGGVGALSYTWSNSLGNTSSISGLVAGTYTLTVSDNNNCSSSFEYILEEPATLSASLSTSSYNGYSVSCSGASDGDITVSAEFGVSPYTYLWSTLSTDAMIDGLSVGLFSVVVTDANGCTVEVSTTLTEPVPFAISSLVATSNYDGYNVSCNGSNDGSADLTLSTGISPFTYLWSNGETTEDAVSLPAGLNSVTITDANGCVVVGQVTLSEPALFAVSATVTSNYNGLDVTCAGALNGSVAVTSLNGFGPYSYNWSTGSNGSSLTGVGAGAYDVTVTDNHGCVATTSVVVQDAAPITYTFVQNNVSCNGSADGSIDITVSGGTQGNYMYFWSNSTNGEDVSNLSPGMYYFLAIDMNWCHKVSEIFTITQPDVLVATASVSSDFNGYGSSCSGSADATIQSSVVGGVSPYTYYWNNMAGSSVLSSASEGVYSLQVVDANGCSAFTSATVTAPQPIVAGVVLSDFNGYTVSCVGGNNGNAEVNVLSGGIAPFSYAWSAGGFTGSVGTALVAGNYTVTVTDAIGCSGTVSFIVTEPSPISVSLTAVSNYGGYNVSCLNGNDGMVNSFVSGGVGGYTYLWSNMMTTSDVTGLGAGMAELTVSDLNGCTSSASIILTSPSELTAVVSVSTAISCYGSSDGTLSVTANGGYAPYTYNWSTGGNGSMLSNVPAGNYIVTVTDFLGCQTIVNYAFTSVEPLIMTVDVTNISCNGLNDGAATATVTGGTAPYSFYWNTGSTSNTISNLTPGLYYGFALDANNCATNFVPIMISTPTTLTLSAVSSDVTCNGAADGSIDLSVSGGTAPYTYTWSNGSQTQDLSGIGGGEYTVTVADAGTCSGTYTVTITEGGVLVVNASSLDADCQTNGFGSIDLAISGGISPYTVSWSNGAMTEDLSGLSEGDYTYTVTDNSGCSTMQTISIAYVSPVMISAISDDVNCYGGNDGMIDLTVSGGSGIYTYNWAGPGMGVSMPFDWTYTITSVNATILLPAGLNANLNGSSIAAGDVIGVFFNNNGVESCAGYSVWTGDVNSIAAWGADGNDAGYTESESYTLKVYQASSGMVYDVDAVFDLVQFPNGGSWTVNGMSGISSLSYMAPADLSGLTVGTYVVNVSDSQGCTGSATVVISEPTMLDVVIASTSSSCQGVSDGSLTASVTGGVAPYTYGWSTGGNVETLTGLSAGNYELTVFDANGCLWVGDASVAEPMFGLSAVVVNPTYLGGTDGSIDLTVMNDNAAYTLVWSNGAIIEDLAGLTAGSYTVTVSSGTCEYIETYTITEGITPDPLSILLVASGDVNCMGGSNGSIDISVMGGVAPYVYNWSNGAGTEDLTGLTAGTYYVTVSDAAPIMSTATYMVVINEPASSVSISDIIVTHPVSCLYNGGAEVTVSGGVSPYTYSWSNGSTSEDLVDANGGIYTLVVTDANGCIASSGNILLNSYEMDLNIVVTPNVCAGASNASVTVIVNNQLPSSFLWSNGATTDYVTNLSAGSYAVTVSDFYGCSVTEFVTVVDPAPMVVTISTGSIGFTAVVVSGATGPVSYMWSNGKPYQSIKNLVPGTQYCVTVTDANGCTGVACATWGGSSIPMAFSLTKEEIVAGLTELDFNLYPNPNRDGQFSIALPQVEIDEILMQVSDNTGRVILSEMYSNLSDAEIRVALEGADAGVYYVRLILNKKHSIVKRMVIIR